MGFRLALSITPRKERERELQRERDRLDEFAGVVSHDLRNPLNVAEGNLDLLREEYDGGHLAPIDRALTRMDNLVDDLLTLARNGEQTGELEPIDVGGFSEICWQNIVAADASIRTETNRTVWADRNRFKQLLENVLRNAVDHGGDSVTVTVGELDDGFYVEDDGVGIPEADFESVFETGYSTTVGGTGFGLTIVKQVAEGHGWEIRLTESSTGGTRFEFLGVESAGSV